MWNPEALCATPKACAINSSAQIITLILMAATCSTHRLSPLSLAGPYKSTAFLSRHPRVWPSPILSFLHCNLEFTAISFLQWPLMASLQRLHSCHAFPGLSCPSFKIGVWDYGTPQSCIFHACETTTIQWDHQFLPSPGWEGSCFVCWPWWELLFALYGANLLGSYSCSSAPLPSTWSSFILPSNDILKRIHLSAPAVALSQWNLYEKSR